MSKTDILSLKMAFALVVFCLPSWLSAADISLSAKVSQSQIPFETCDTLSVILSWSGPPFAYQIDQFPQPILEKFKVLGSSSTVSSRPDSTLPESEVTTRIMQYVLEPVDYGTGVIHPLTIKATDRATGKVHDLLTGKITVDIAKPIPREKGNSSSTSFILIIATVVVVGGGLGWVFFIRHKKGIEKAAPDLRYVDRLEEIKKDTVADNKLFYARLYRLLIDYLEKEQSLPFSGKTGQEVINALKEHEDKTEIKAWLNQALEIKYRPDTPSSSEVEDVYQAVLAYLKEKA